MFKQSLTAQQKTWLILLLYGLLSIILTHPTVWSLTSIVSGADAEDPLQYTWLLWWGKEAILTLQQLPSTLTHWGWPEGIIHPLLFVTPYLELSGLPLTLFAGPIAAYNIQLLLAFTLSGFTTYLLGYAITGNRWAGFVAGIIFAFSAHRWAHAFAGHLPHLTIYWAPLFTWAMWKFVQTPRKKWALLAGLFAGLTALVHLMHVAYWLIPTTLVLLVWGWRYYSKNTPGWWSKLIFDGLWGLVPLLLLITPFYSLFFLNINNSDSKLKAAGLAGNATDLLAYVSPAPTNPIMATFNLVPPISHQLFTRTDSLDEGVAYLGMAGLVLAVLGLAARWRPHNHIWLWLALTSGILALGPFLKFGGELVSYQSGDLSSYLLMPYALFSKIPLLSWGRTTGRLNQTLMLAFSMLAAFGVMTLFAYFKYKAVVWTIIVGLCFVFVLESLVVFPMPRSNPAVSPYYLQLQAEQVPATTGILDLPLESRREENNAMFFQTYHRRPIVGGFIHRKFEQVERSRRFANLLFIPPVDSPAFKPPANKQRLAALRSLNIDTVIVHKDLISKPADQTQAEFAATLLGSPSYEDDFIQVYKMPPGEPLQTPLTLLDPDNWQVDKSTASLSPDNEASWHIYAYSPQPAWSRWNIGIASTSEPTVLSISNETTHPQELLVTTPQYAETGSIYLPAGFSRFNWSSDKECHQSEEACIITHFDYIELHPTNGPEEPVATWGKEHIQLSRYTASFDSETNQLSLGLYWLPLKKLEVEPTLFIHIIDKTGNQIAQADLRLLNGRYPPDVWVLGVPVHEVVTLPTDQIDDWTGYTIKLGLYDVGSGKRFPISSPQTIDNSIALTLFPKNAE